jgi:hypothetical protein
VKLAQSTPLRGADVGDVEAEELPKTGEAHPSREKVSKHQQNKEQERLNPYMISSLSLAADRADGLLKEEGRGTYLKASHVLKSWPR